jgi:hypothetical protein
MRRNCTPRSTHQFTNCFIAARVAWLCLNRGSVEELGVVGYNVLKKALTAPMLLETPDYRLLRLWNV